VAVALCARVETAAAANPAATANERRIELIFEIVFIVLPFFISVIDPASGWISITGCDDQDREIFPMKVKTPYSEPGLALARSSLLPILRRMFL
jgi:hypothetical protein